MKASLIIHIVAVVLSLSMLASVFSSCSAEIFHTHSYEKTETVRTAACDKGGKIVRRCTECGVGDKYTTAPRGHIPGKWKNNGKGEYIKTCTVCGDVVAREMIYTEYSSGLELKRGVKSTSYTVVGIGSCTDSVIVIPPDVDGMPIADIGDYAFAGCNNIKAVIIPDTVTRIGVQAFGGTSVEKVFIPDSVKYIYDGAFARCRELTELILPNSLTTLGNGVFANTTSLSELIIPNSLTVLGSLDRSSFRSISIPSGITKLSDKAFMDCTALEEVLLPDTLTEIGDSAFEGCVSLRNAILPDSVEILGSSAFKGCVSLEVVSIPKGVTTLAESAFVGCVSLGKIYIHSKLRYMHSTSFLGVDVSVAEFMISGNNPWIRKVRSSIVEIENPDSDSIPNTVVIGSAKGRIPTDVSITRIGACAFRDRLDLKRIAIPKNITHIADGAFYGCENLVRINYEGTVAEWEKMTLGVDWRDEGSDLKVRCSDGDIILSDQEESQ